VPACAASLAACAAFCFRLLLGSCVSALGGILHSLPVRLPPAARSLRPAIGFASSMLCTLGCHLVYRSLMAYLFLRAACAFALVCLCLCLLSCLFYVASFPLQPFPLSSTPQH
jgi:hypothetical protein